MSMSCVKRGSPKRLDLLELESAQRLLRALRIPQPKAGPQQLFAHLTELECLDEPLLGGHGAKNAKV
jgi:hypothetical protein